MYHYGALIKLFHSEIYGVFLPVDTQKDKSMVWIELSGVQTAER